MFTHNISFKNHPLMKTIKHTFFCVNGSIVAFGRETSLSGVFVYSLLFCFSSSFFPSFFLVWMQWTEVPPIFKPELKEVALFASLHKQLMLKHDVRTQISIVLLLEDVSFIPRRVVWLKLFAEIKLRTELL